MTATPPPPSTPNALAVLNERLTVIREEQRAALTKLDGIGTQLAEMREFRMTTARDISELRQELQAALLRQAELDRTVKGLGKSFDGYREAEALARAKLQGQLVLFKWLAGVAGATATAVIIGFVLRLLGM